MPAFVVCHPQLSPPLRQAQVHKGKRCPARLTPRAVSSEHVERVPSRGLYFTLKVASVSVLAAATLLSVRPVGALSVESCISGVGPGCEAASEGNPLIQSLQEKSRINKDKNLKELRDKYWENGYKSYFGFSFGELKHNADGTWEVLDLKQRALRKIEANKANKAGEVSKKTEVDQIK